MLTLLPRKHSNAISLLFLGAHSDDIEIGCCGSVFRLLEQFAIEEVTWVVFSALDERGDEAKASAELLLKNVKSKKMFFYSFKDGYFPYIGADIKDKFEALKGQSSPDIVFTHYRNDLHQDHRLICELTWNTFRNHLILEYEVMKYDGDLGVPNFFLHLTEAQCQKKMNHLRQHFKSQWGKHWFEDITFRSMARLRGIESNAPEKYAEAFHCRKAIM